MDSFRESYTIHKDCIIEYLLNEEECGISFDIKKNSILFKYRLLHIDKQQYYFLGKDAERAFSFLSNLHDVETKVLDLYNRIELLNESS